MKLVAISRVRNEADIIEPFVRHHAAYFNKIIILDDGGNDGTFETLRKLQAEGLPVVLVQEGTVGYEQSRYMTRLMHMAVDQFGADWVVPLDADEFIEPESGKTVAQILKHHQNELVSIPWHNFEWRAEYDADPEPNPVIKQRLRLPPRADHNKVLIPKSLIGQDTILDQGNHRLLQERPILIERPLQTIALCHFPIRSVSQYASKIAVGYLQYQSMPDWNGETGFHYLEPFKALREGGIEALKVRMVDDAKYYSCSAAQRRKIDSRSRAEPLRYQGGAIKYPTSASTPLQNVLYCAGAIARDRANSARMMAMSSNDSAAAPLGPPKFRLSRRLAARLVRMRFRTQAWLDVVRRHLRI